MKTHISKLGRQRAQPLQLPTSTHAKAKLHKIRSVTQSYAIELRIFAAGEDLHSMYVAVSGCISMWHQRNPPIQWLGLTIIWMTAWHFTCVLPFQCSFSAIQRRFSAGAALSKRYCFHQVTRHFRLRHVSCHVRSCVENLNYTLSLRLNHNDFKCNTAR